MTNNRSKLHQAKLCDKIHVNSSAAARARLVGHLRVTDEQEDALELLERLFQPHAGF